ncbi:MAG TPA: DJ-1/PfpI family protein, partial [Longimicrobiaceae bacterium]|nr:DJ-1/PfpI family protein [Longimicrobiaceae bacterium]
ALYDGVDMLDVVGPFEIFSWAKGLGADRDLQIHMLSATGRKVRTSSQSYLYATDRFSACPQLDLIFVPGGEPTAVGEALNSTAFMGFLKAQVPGCTYVTSVCYGALLLAGTGILDGRVATTHWSALSCLALFSGVGVAPGYPRYYPDEPAAESGRYVLTGGGISSGLDQALRIVADITGSAQIAEQVQMTIQYHPQPAFNAGDPAVAPEPIRDPGLVGSSSGVYAPLAKAIHRYQRRQQAERLQIPVAAGSPS